MKELCQKIKKAMIVFESFDESGIMAYEDYKNHNILAIVNTIKDLLDELHDRIPEKYKDETFIEHYALTETTKHYVDDYVYEVYFLFVSLSDHCEETENEYVMRNLYMLSRDLGRFLTVYCNVKFGHGNSD